MGYSNAATNSAVRGYNESSGYGVFGHSNSGEAVTGEAYAGFGGYFVTYANADDKAGLVGENYGTDRGTAVVAVGHGGSTGISAVSDTGWAGHFSGKVHVAGTLSKAAGSFLIDHPLDPANKVLRHSFVESPDMKNVYDGVVTLDKNGEARVELPSYFGALNRDFRYQLTNIGAPASIYIAEEIKNNEFRIAGGKPEMKVSWQVTGIRKDIYAQDNPIVVEEYKAKADRGKYYYSRDASAKRIGPTADLKQAADSKTAKPEAPLAAK
jgi:hypothetical protein